MFVWFSGLIIWNVRFHSMEEEGPSNGADIWCLIWCLGGEPRKASGGWRIRSSVFSRWMSRRAGEYRSVLLLLVACCCFREASVWFSLSFQLAVRLDTLFLCCSLAGCWSSRVWPPAHPPRPFLSKRCKNPHLDPQPSKTCLGVVFNPSRAASDKRV